MSDRRKIEERIKKKEQELQALEDQARETKVYIQALYDVLKMFPKDASAGSEATIRAGSMVALARDAIRAKGQPMHVDEILAAMQKEPTRTNKTALGGSLSAYVRKGEVFTRPAPNTFGLVELEQRAAPLSEPPADFGEEPIEKPGDDDIPF